MQATSEWGGFVRGAEKGVFEFLGDPDGADEEVDHALKERGLVAFDAVAGEEENPSGDEESEANAPVGEASEDDGGEDDGNTDAVHEFVPGVGVLVIVLRHVLGE